MLTAEAIQTLLRAGEGETLEFKEQFGTGVIETAVAFANTHQLPVLSIEDLVSYRLARQQAAG